MRRHRESGYTLLEIVLTLAITGILVALAQTAWQQHRYRIGRSDATGALLTVALHQEAFYLETGRYASAVGPAPPAGLGLPGTERGWYRLELRDADAAGYRALAIPFAGSPQARDERCRGFSIDAAGRRDSWPSPPAVCWR